MRQDRVGDRVLIDRVERFADQLSQDFQTRAHVASIGIRGLLFELFPATRQTVRWANIAKCGYW